MTLKLPIIVRPTGEAWYNEPASTVLGIEYFDYLPTVVLNSPADTSSGSDTTPTLNFTGTDTESNDIRYNVQVDTSNTFNSVINTGSDLFNQTSLDTGLWTQTTGGSATISYSASGVSIAFPASSTSSTIGQLQKNSNINLTGSSTYLRIITMPSSSTAADAELRLAIDENNWLRWVYESGTIYAQDMVSSSRNTRYSVTWNSTTHKYLRIRESGGTTYWDTGADDGSGGITWTNRHSRSNPITVTSLQVQLNGYCYQNETSPGYFKFGEFIIGDRSALIDKVSGTDAGFSGSPDNTDPFTSGQAVTYTVQSALSLTTYYWRVRGIDPSGSNTYGSWATTRSFTVTSGGGAALPDVNIGGTWKAVSGAYVNIGGTWKTVSNIYVNIGGTWKELS